jgi:aspartate-semialdehyde dehydrogenase
MQKSPSKIPIGILGATGAVGQRFLSRLAGHPDFTVAALAASEKSAGRRYAEVSPWRLAEPPPPGLADTVLRRAEPDLPCRIVFSALDAAAARELEPRFAAAGYLVFSNASAHRMEEDVPLLVPEVNADHAALLPIQRGRRGWTGGIVTNPNCSATQLVLALAPLQRAFGIETVIVTTLQSVSGAGYPGVASLDALGNVLPDIPEEAEKIERETARILGRFANGRVEPAALTISAHTYRVAVENGHTESVSVALSRKATEAELVEAWREFRADPEVALLPSAPARPLAYVDEPHAPQPRRHAEREGGMVTWIGGLAPCAALDWKFTVVGNNTVRGAAGGSLLNAELLVRALAGETEGSAAAGTRLRDAS